MEKWEKKQHQQQPNNQVCVKWNSYVYCNIVGLHMENIYNTRYICKQQRNDMEFIIFRFRIAQFGQLFSVNIMKFTYYTLHTNNTISNKQTNKCS